MILNINHDSQFEIDSISHGSIKFDDLTVWRSLIIESELKQIDKMSSNEVAIIVARNCVKEIDGIVIDKPEDKEQLKKIVLTLTNEEIIAFSSAFLEKNKFLTGEEDDRFTVSFGDGEERPIEPDKDLIGHKWPDSPIDKLKEAWLIQRKKQEDLVNRTLGLGHFKAFEGISAFARKQQDLIAGIVRPLKMPPIYTPSFDTQIQETMRSIQESESKIRAHRASVDAAHLAVPELLEDLMQLQREMYQTSTELQKAANKYLDEQITLAKDDSRKAGKQAIIAIIIASVGLIASVILGAIQISVSLKPNEQLVTQNALLEKLLNQSNEETQAVRKMSDEIINRTDMLMQADDYHAVLDNIYIELKKIEDIK